MNDQVTIAGYTTGAEQLHQGLHARLRQPGGSQPTPHGQGEDGVPPATDQRRRQRQRSSSTMPSCGSKDSRSTAACPPRQTVPAEWTSRQPAPTPVGHYVSHNIIYDTRNFTGIYVNATSARCGTTSATIVTTRATRT